MANATHMHIAMHIMDQYPVHSMCLDNLHPSLSDGEEEAHHCPHDEDEAEDEDDNGLRVQWVRVAVLVNVGKCLGGEPGRGGGEEGRGGREGREGGEGGREGKPGGEGGEGGQVQGRRQVQLIAIRMYTVMANTCTCMCMHACTYMYVCV